LAEQQLDSPIGSVSRNCPGGKQELFANGRPRLGEMPQKPEDVRELLLGKR
jgi:hypothetical protein